MLVINIQNPHCTYVGYRSETHCVVSAGPDYKFRLFNNDTGSSNATQGLLEVYFNNQWGTVCDDFFNMNAANVICKMMNFGGALDFHPVLGPEHVPIWLDDIYCQDGNEGSIDECTHSEVGVHDCRHHEDVYLSCYCEYIYVCINICTVYVHERVRDFVAFIMNMGGVYLSINNFSKNRNVDILNHMSSSAVNWMLKYKHTYVHMLLPYSVCIHI